MASIRRSKGRAGRLFAALAAFAGTAALAASPAAADPGSGTATLNFAKQGKPTSLSAQGVKISYRGGGNGKAKASKKSRKKGAGQTVALKIVDVTLGEAPSAKVRGNLQLKRGERKANLTSIEIRSNAKRTVLRGKLGNEEIVAFSAKGAATVEGLSVKQGPARLSLTRKGAEAFAEKLGLDKIAAGKIGTFVLNASQDAKPAPPAPTPAPTPTPDPKPDPDPYPYTAQCPVAKVPGPAFGEPPATVPGPALAPSFGPTSQPVTGTAIEWGFKVGFREYVLGSPPPGTLQPLDGATAVGSDMEAADSYFSFPVSGGTYERGTEADHSDDLLVADGTGTVLMCKSGHGFNIVLKNPAVTIDGAQSRLTADVGANMHGTWYPFQRTDIAELDLSSIEPTITDGGNTVVWEDVPVEMSENGAKATGLGDMYPAGTVLDTITVKTSLERPLTAACTIPSGLATPAAVNFSLDPLPSLTSPQTGTGGTINWGLRRATRNSVVGAGGTFQLFGGATEGFPGDMGGSDNTFPPSVGGGLGKFFRFPVSEWEWEEGEPSDPSDDRLIATSEATVGFCNPDGGNYGLILSKPTLVVDGSESRLIANTYSFSGGTPNPNPASWMGGRVEVVSLDATGVDAEASGGTVSWGDVPPDNVPVENGLAVVGGFTTSALTLAFLAEGGGTTAGGFDKVAAQIVLPAS